MQELRNCPLCNSLFTFRGTSSVCPNCFEIEHGNFSKVRDYITEHPGCALWEITAATGIKEDTLFRFIREGRLIYRKA